MGIFDSKAEKFRKACKDGNVARARELLAADRSVITAKDEYGRTGLYFACGEGKADVVRLLLADPRLDVNAREDAGWTAFVKACREGRVDVVRLLLADSRLDINAKNEGGETGFIRACYEGKADVVQLLLADKRVDVNAKDQDNWTGLYFACSAGKADVVRVLLNSPRVDVNTKEKSGWTGFIKACGEGNADLVRLLLADPRVDVNAKDVDGRTGFIVACWNSKAEVVRLLLGDPKVDLNATTEITKLTNADSKAEASLSGLTAFVISCWKGKDEMVSLLLANPRIDPNLADADGNTALIHACEQKHDRVVRLLLGQSAGRVDVTVKNKAGLSAADVGTPDTKRLMKTRLDEAEAAQKQQEAKLEAERLERERREAEARSAVAEEARLRERREAEARAAIAEQTRQRELDLRMKELELKERELVLKEKFGAAAPAALGGNPLPPNTDITVVPKMSGGSSSSSRGSAKTAGPDSSFVSKLRIDANDVKYDEKDVLGEGGFGKVYRGSLRGATAVAVKTIKGSVGPRTVKMFLDEIAVWEGLNQRNVLPLLAFCETPPMMVSEFCTDGNLRDRLEDLNWDQTMGLRYLKGVAEGMAYLHSFRVLHGDLKSLNIMIDHDVPKIADFGLSRVRTHLSNSSSMNAGGGSGTPPFMAPEIWDGEKLKAPADVYAFAMVCYEVTSEGMYPFQGMNAMAIMRKVCDEQKRPTRPEEASDAIWALMQRMWAQEAATRPAFVEVAAEMARW